MKISEEMDKYLMGEEFSSSGQFDYNSEKRRKWEREEALIKILDRNKSQSVVHLGCCDHMDLIDKKIHSGSWLHGNLQKKCKNLMGIDINEEAVSYLLEEKKISKIICADIEKDVKLIKEKMDEYNNGEKWNYLLGGGKTIRAH